MLINRLGAIHSLLDQEIHYLHSDSIFCAVPWHSLSKVTNKSISGSIKKYSTHSRNEMEELSKQISLQYLCAILNSHYGAILLQEQRGGDYHIYPDHLRNIPIPIASVSIQSKIDKAVDDIMTISNKDSDEYQKLLQKIDMLVYKAYDLSFDQVVEVDPQTPISKEEYENFNHGESN